MLIEPQLKGMNADDLNQRYTNSFINYDGRYEEVLSFHSSTEFSTRRYQHVPFDWKLVNIERLPSRWYSFKYDGAEYAGYFTYKPSRQYSRGLSHRNTYIFVPGKNWVIDEIILDQIHGQSKQGCPPKLFKEELVDRLKKNGFVLLTNQMAIVKNVLYYRLNNIGSWTGKEIFLDNSNFTQEVADLGFGSLITYDPSKKKVEPPEPKKLKSLFDEWNLGEPPNQVRRPARVEMNPVPQELPNDLLIRIRERNAELDAQQRDLIQRINLEAMRERGEEIEPIPNNDF